MTNLCRAGRVSRGIVHCDSLEKPHCREAGCIRPQSGAERGTWPCLRDLTLESGYLILTELGAVLSKARAQMEKQQPNYGVDEVTLELDIAYTLTQSANMPTKVKPEFWVLGRGLRDAKDGVPSAQWDTQHLILRLTPRMEDIHARESDIERISRLPPKRQADVE